MNKENGEKEEKAEDKQENEKKIRSKFDYSYLGRSVNIIYRSERLG